MGLKHLKEDEILNTLMIPPRGELAESQVSGQLAERLEALPWLESSSVQFSLPNRIVVEVTEREPLAVIHAEDFYLIDTDGKLVSRASAEQKQDFLLVEGFSGLELKEGDLLPRTTLREAQSLAVGTGTGRELAAAQGAFESAAGVRKPDMRSIRREIVSASSWGGTASNKN